MVIFKPSNVHQGHYIIVDGESIGVVNLYAYKTSPDYKKEVDDKINNYIKNGKSNNKQQDSKR
jgi:hypothetical protein